MTKEELKEEIIRLADKEKVSCANIVYVNYTIDKEKETENRWNMMLLLSEYMRANKEGKKLSGQRDYQVFSYKNTGNIYSIMLLRV